MDNTKIVKAYCSKSKQYYSLEVYKYGTSWEVVNVTHLSKEEAKFVSSEVKQDDFFTSKNLLPCLNCGSRKVAGCSCSKKNHECSAGMKYQFDCVYCKHLEIDYSLPEFTEDEIKNNKKIVLSQGKEFKVITFSNVKWEKFDNINHHPSGAEYREPKIHVKADKENIEFHGYNISAMDEGVSYTINSTDDFEIECSVDTSNIQPHPGGEFYVNLGIISAKITERGGTFCLDGKTVATVGTKFSMKLSLSEGGMYSVTIDGKHCGKSFKSTNDKIKVIFGFAHGSHHCHILSHAYVKNIKMRHGRDTQNEQ